MEQAPQHHEAAATQNAQGDNAATATVTNRRTDDKYAPSFFHGKSSEDASEYVAYLERYAAYKHLTDGEIPSWNFCRFCYATPLRTSATHSARSRNPPGLISRQRSWNALGVPQCNAGRIPKHCGHRSKQRTSLQTTLSRVSLVSLNTFRRWTPPRYSERSPEA